MEKLPQTKKSNYTSFLISSDAHVVKTGRGHTKLLFHHFLSQSPGH